MTRILAARLLLFAPAYALEPGCYRDPNVIIIAGDSVAMDTDGHAFRIIGFETPEAADRAECDDERERAAATIARLRDLLDSWPSLTATVANGATARSWRAGRVGFGSTSAPL